MIGTRRHNDFEKDEEATVTHKPILVGFRSAFVFDVSQTEGEELPKFTAKIIGTVGDTGND